ncbi:hypothetical protein H6501_03090 [Candidatus Woesearchaeota archaeon]|nr:hypothetical protein [Candidatus Woesearchaeota archaeon]USN43634.1 MAG: hypothetical protein H6500_04550 [Candidatus Woesearchaeota archaeon]
MEHIISFVLDGIEEKEEKETFQKIVSLLWDYFITVVKYNPEPEAKYTSSELFLIREKIMKYRYSSREGTIFNFFGLRITKKNEYSEPESLTGKFSINLVYENAYFDPRPDFTRLYQNLFSYVTERFDKDTIIEFDSGNGILYDDSLFYYCKDFETFFKSTIEERWGYKLNEEEKQTVLEFMKEKGTITKNKNIVFFITYRNPQCTGTLALFLRENFKEKRLGGMRTLYYWEK